MRPIVQIGWSDIGLILSTAYETFIIRWWTVLILALWLAGIASLLFRVVRRR